MPCTICTAKGNDSQFQQEYKNGGKPLVLKSIPTVTMEQADSYVLGDLHGYMMRKPRVTTEISFITFDGEEVTLSGDVATILNILEKLK